MPDDVTVAFAGPEQMLPPANSAPAPAAPQAVITPTQQIINRSNELIRTVSAQGRSIAIKRMGVLERARFFEMIGADNAKNEAFLGIAVPAFMAVEIDGQMFGRPLARRELDARMQMLDDDGLDAINAAILKHFGEDEAAGDQLKNAPAIPG